jgi:beta-barrel assembly-enhancing protease
VKTRRHWRAVAISVSAFSGCIATLLFINPFISYSQSSLSRQSRAPRGFNLLTLQQEIDIGRQSAIAVDQRLPLLSDAGVNEYINRLGQRLASLASGASGASGDGYPYSFKTANVAEVNAFAFPGGPIYITRGAIEAARSEGELAGALAHEIAHVALGHGAGQASKAYLARAGLAAFGAVAGQGAAQKIIDGIGGFGFNAAFLKYSHEAEAEACALAAQILTLAGYDPREMAAFFRELRRGERAEASKLKTFLDDHPAAGADGAADWADGRLVRVVGRVSVNPRTSQISADDFRQIQTRVMELPGDLPIAHTIATVARRIPTVPIVMDESSNRASQNIKAERPSSHLQDFWLHGGLRVQVTYPENWFVYPGGDNLGVTLIPPGGLVETRDASRLVYGAVLRRYRPIGDNSLWTGLQQRSFRYIGGRGELVEATNDLLDSVLQNNPHLDFSRGSDRRGLIDGVQTITLTLTGRSPATGRGERAQLYICELEDGDIVYAIFVAPDDEYDDFRQAFDRMLRGLKINDKELRRGK